MSTQQQSIEKDTKKPKKLVIGGVNIDKMIKDAKASYVKKEAGLAEQLTNGSTIPRPTDKEDYVVWSYGNHWQELTGQMGIPFGRFVQISGKPDSGKSSHAMAFMVAAQEQDVIVILWDSEKKFASRRFQNKMGGDPDNLVVVNTNNIVDGAKAVAAFVHAAKAQNPDVKILIVWDSVGASLNSNEDNDEDEDFSMQPGVTAKEVTWAVKKFGKLMHKYFDKKTGKDSIAVLAINQTYANIGSVGQTEKGGGELYYMSSIIVQLTRKKDLNRIKDKKAMKYGIITRAKVKKNHLFDGDESVAEMDLVISAKGVHIASEIKNFDDIQEDSDSLETEEGSDE